MNDGNMYVYLIGAVGGLATIVTPLLKLNSNIVKLTTTLQYVVETLESLGGRVTTHGNDIDEIKVTLANHEVRIKVLEKHEERV